MTDIWKEPEVAALRKLIAKDKSFGEIAKYHADAIGGRTRCAIAGKCHRIGLIGSPKGQRHNARSLTDEQALFVQESDERQSELAARFGVSNRVIGDIRRGRTYKDVSPS